MSKRLSYQICNLKTVVQIRREAPMKLRLDRRKHVGNAKKHHNPVVLDVRANQPC